MSITILLRRSLVFLCIMVENLLALTRLEQQDFTLRLEPELLEDVIAEAVQITSRRAAHHDLRAEMPEGMSGPKLSFSGCHCW